MNDQHFRPALDVDLPRIRSLLHRCDLPVPDLPAVDKSFIVCLSEESVIGCIGLECHGSHGLIRSFAVEESFRSRHIGSTLLSLMHQLCLEQHIIDVHLLTTTVPAFFKSRGYSEAPRDLAPTEIQRSEEFSRICPSSSIYLTRNLQENVFSSKEFAQATK